MADKKRLYVFVSLPMAERTENEIRGRQLKIVAALNANSDHYQYILIDSFSKEEAPEINNKNLWYLGSSIQLLGMADLAVFDEGWRDGRGCRVEHAVCELYKIPYMYVYEDMLHKEENDKEYISTEENNER